MLEKVFSSRSHEEHLYSGYFKGPLNPLKFYAEFYIYVYFWGGGSPLLLDFPKEAGAPQSSRVTWLDAL